MKTFTFSKFQALLDIPNPHFVNQVELKVLKQEEEQKVRGLILLFYLAILIV